MAIRQERMISLINAAVEYRNISYLASRLLVELEKSFEYLILHPNELQQKIILLSREVSGALVEAMRHDVSISMERDLFARKHRENEKAREKMAEKRRASKDYKGPRKFVQRLNEKGQIEYSPVEARQTGHIPINEDLPEINRDDIARDVSLSLFKDNPEDLPEEVREAYYKNHPEQRPRTKLDPASIEYDPNYVEPEEDDDDTVPIP